MKVSKSHWMGHAIIAIFFMSIVFATVTSNAKKNSDTKNKTYSLQSSANSVEVACQ